MALSVGNTNATVTSNMFSGNWSASLAAIFSLENVPQVWPVINKRFGPLFYMTDFLTMAGQTGVCKARSVKTLEEGAFKAYFTQSAQISTGAAGADITITPTTATDFDSNGVNGRIKIGDDIAIPGAYQTNGYPRNYRVRVLASGTDGTATCTYTCTPWSNAGTSGYLSAAQIGTAIPAGTKLSIVSHSEGIGSTSPKGDTDGLLSRTHSTRIIRKSFQMEGGYAAIERYSDNATGEVDWNSALGRALLLAKRKFDLLWDGALYTGEANDNTAQVYTSQFGGSNAVPSFNGLRSWLEIAGGKQNYSSSYTFDDLYSLKPMLQAVGISGGDVLFGVGSGLGLQLEKAGLDFTREFSKSDLMKNYDSLGVIYKNFTANGIRFLFHEFQTWANPQGNGVDPALTDQGFIIPMDRVTVTNQGTGEKIQLPHMALLDFDNNGEKRGLIAGTLSGINGLGYQFSNANDGFEHMLLGEKMALFTGVEQLVAVTKV